MKVGVIGTRRFEDYALMHATLNKINNKFKIDLIISGGAQGADSLAEKWADSYEIKTIIHKPDWSVGKKAAAIRNIKIVEDSDIIIAFWDGISKGTKMTIDMATKNKKPIFCIKFKK
jgi:hypothetical protein